MLCPHCHRLISRDEERCPYCGTSAPGVWWKNLSFLAMLQDPSQFVRLIITVNVVMYVLSLLLDPRGTAAAQGFGLFSFLAPSNRSLVLLGATGTYPVFQLHRFWSLLAANYLHGSLMHILFNMVALWQLGPLAIREFGGWRMFVIYTLGGVFGFLVSVLAGVPSHHRRFGRYLQSYRGLALFRQEPGRCLWQRGLQAAGGLGDQYLRLRFSGAGNQQLGTRRRHGGRRTACLSLWLSGPEKRKKGHQVSRRLLHGRHRPCPFMGGRDGISHYDDCLKSKKADLGEARAGRQNERHLGRNQANLITRRWRCRKSW